MKDFTMFDAVKLHVYADTRPFDEFPVEHSPRQRRTYIPDGSHSREVAMLGNLHLTRTTASLVITGSLSKWKKGNNVHALSAEEMRFALGELSEIVGADLDRADVWSLEVSETLLMDHPAITYYPCLLDLPRYQRNLIYSGSTLLFSEKHKSLQFYNKASKILRNLTDDFVGQNLLRVEFKFKDRLARSLDGRKVRGVDLHDEGFIRRMVRYWHAAYRSVKKSRIPLEFGELASVRTVKELSRALECIALSSAIMPDRILAFLHESRLQTAPRNFARMVAHIRALSQDKRNLTTGPLIAELDEKMVEMARKYCPGDSFSS